MRIVPTLAVATFLLAACGAHHESASRQVTLAKYGAYRTQTITVPAGAADARLCRLDAQGFATQARSFVMRYGSTAASSTDVYFLGLREELADFDGRRCDDAALRKALVAQLTPKQRRLILQELTRSMAGRVRKALGPRP